MTETQTALPEAWRRAELPELPPLQVPDPVARQNTEDFIARYGGAPKLPGKGKIKKTESV